MTLLVLAELPKVKCSAPVAVAVQDLGHRGRRRPLGVGDTARAMASGRLPRSSYRTIAEFRRINGKGLKVANRKFVLLCKELGLLGGETIGIDGSFFNASASDASIITKKQLEVDLKQIERAIDSDDQLLSGANARRPWRSSESTPSASPSTPTSVPPASGFIRAGSRSRKTASCAPAIRARSVSAKTAP